jgi:hypothetical protein
MREKRILSICATHVPIVAAYDDPDDEAFHVPVVCWALLEETEHSEDGPEVYQEVIGMVTAGVDGIFPADTATNFAGYYPADDPNLGKSRGGLPAATDTAAADAEPLEEDRR